MAETGDSLAFLFLGVRSGRPARRGEPDLLRWEERVTSWVLVPSSMGERAGIGMRLVARGGGPLVALVAVAFLSFGLISFRRVVPGWPVRSGLVELVTFRVVSKQGERGEAKRS